MKLLLLILSFVLASSAAGFGTQKCSVASTCNCHRRGTVECNQPNCMNEMPTEKMSDNNKKKVINLRIKKFVTYKFIDEISIVFYS